MEGSLGCLEEDSHLYIYIYLHRQPLRETVQKNMPPESTHVLNHGNAGSANCQPKMHLQLADWDLGGSYGFIHVHTHIIFTINSSSVAVHGATP